MRRLVGYIHRTRENTVSNAIGLNVRALVRTGSREDKVKDTTQHGSDETLI